MELNNLSPFDLQPNPWNSNRVERKQFEKLKDSLTRHGAFKPVVVRELADGTLQIIGGYHRNEAAKELGWLEVPVLNLGEMTDDKAKEIGILDNTRYGEDDKDLLDKILEELTDLDGLTAVLPEVEIPIIDDEDDFIRAVEEEDDDYTPEEDDGTRTLKFKLEADKADEIVDILRRVAEDHDYKYSDGYSNYGEALYHILVVEKV